MIKELLMITIIVVYIIDLSGAINSIKYGIWKWLRGNKPYKEYQFKPFDCSLCMSFWIGLIWLFLSHSMSLKYIMILCLFSYLSDVIGDILRLIKDILITLMSKIN